MMVRVITILFTTAILAACATMYGDKYELLSIESDPEGAEVTIYNRSGNQLFKGTTPTSFALGKIEDVDQRKAAYLVTVSKKGYQTYKGVIDVEFKKRYVPTYILTYGLAYLYDRHKSAGKMYKLSANRLRVDLIPEDVTGPK